MEIGNTILLKWSLTFRFVCEFFGSQTTEQIVQVIFEGKIEEKKIKLLLVHIAPIEQITKVQDAIFNAAAKKCIFTTMHLYKFRNSARD